MDNYLLQPSIKSLGHSGCEIELIYKSGYRIRKTASNSAYNNRLLAQINKQQRFSDDYLRTPQIHDVRVISGLLTAEMEYINAADFICYLEVRPVDKILGFIETLCACIQAKIETYPVGTLSKDTIRKKLESVKHGIADNPLVSEMVSLVPDMPNLVAMPLGPCHGDFTFSNMLITRDDEIYVIDLLDSFVEAPLIDIVKLRQDTHHYWSVGRSRRDFDRTKIEIILDQFDEVICRTFGGTNWWVNYPFFQRLNLCRILPYVKDQKDAESLKVEIARVRI